MFCDCQEPAFIITKYIQEHDKLIVLKTYGCGRSLMEETKRKLRCKFNQVEKIGESLIKNATIKKTIDSKPRQETYVDHLERTIGLIKINQTNDIPFDHLVSKIMFLAKQLNIPTYTPSTHTIEEYCNIANYYIRNPITRQPLQKKKSIKMIKDIDDLLKPKIIKKKSVPIQSKNVKKPLINKQVSTKFITGGQNEDHHQNEEENEFDVENCESEVEDEVEEEECLSD